VNGRAAWLSDEVLLVCEPERGVEARATSPRTAATTLVAPEGRITAVPAGDPLSAEMGERLTDLKTFLREVPAGWDAPARARLLCFLVSLGGEFEFSPSFSEGLRRAREALRERQPLSLPDPRLQMGIAVERLHRIDEQSFYVRGRAWDETAPIAALSAITPEGERVELWDLVAPHPGAPGGFAGMFGTEFPTRGMEGWVFEAVNESGRGVEAATAVSPDPLRTIFADAAVEFDEADSLRERHLRPAVTRLLQLRRGRTGLVEFAGLGQTPRVPEVSLVIPLQRRIDLIEHQIVQFVADPEISGCEILYVLAEPERSDALRELAAHLFALYGLPLRLAAVTETADLPLTCELGASLARAERLLFLGSNVIPDRPGWLSRLAAPINAEPAVAAATPKLLYADEAIDQAGLEYAVPAAGGPCRVRRRLRGMHRDSAAAAESVPVPAAGLACLMLDAAALGAAGGLRGEYGLAEYEGSDLTRRLASAGSEVRYVAEAELYRLEGLGAEPEPLGEPYARWLHSRLWADTLAGAAA
jgi:hypothetical protein